MPGNIYLKHWKHLNKFLSTFIAATEDNDNAEDPKEESKEESKEGSEGKQGRRRRRSLDVEQDGTVHRRSRRSVEQNETVETSNRINFISQEDV